MTRQTSQSTGTFYRRLRCVSWPFHPRSWLSTGCPNFAKLMISQILNLEPVQQFMHATSPNFPIYNSPFKSFPFLRSRSHQMLPASDRQQTSSSAFSSTLIPSLASSTVTAPYPLHASTSSILLGLKHLRTAIIFQTLDPSKQICQYELPGGRRL